MSRQQGAIAAFIALLAGLFWPRRADAATGEGYTVQDLGTGTTAAPEPSFMQLEIPEAAQPEQAAPSTAEQNTRAFLQMISAAEGTSGEAGYGALFGWPREGRSFDPYGVSDHPRVFFRYTDKAGKTLRTSAAGKYQIVWTTWHSYRGAFQTWARARGLSTAGFTPATQDAFAMFLLYRRGALGLVERGRLFDALQIARAEWASLPGAGVNQPERTNDFVVSAYRNAGGTLA